MRDKRQRLRGGGGGWVGGLGTSPAPKVRRGEVGGGGGGQLAMAVFESVAADRARENVAPVRQKVDVKGNAQKGKKNDDVGEQSQARNL